MTMVTRRTFGKVIGGMAMMGAIAPNIARGAGQRVVVLGGGGFAGATAAKALRLAAPNLEVVLIDKRKEFISCPRSNSVIAGLRDIKEQTWGYEGLKKSGVTVLNDEVVQIDAVTKSVDTLEGGQTVTYDRLILAPGIAFKFDTIEGYSEDVANQTMPHAWKAGPQTLQLAAQLQAMNDGENVLIIVPEDPYRCPPGPYERASLIAYYLKQHKPKSKVIILDAKDQFSKQSLFQEAWDTLGYNVEWVPGSTGGKVLKVDAKAMTVTTSMDTYHGGVINLIPPQKAGLIAQTAGLADASGWCPVDFRTFESTRRPKIHVIGDACFAAPMPKSAYSANVEAKIAAAAVLALLKGQQPEEPAFLSTCYSLASPDYGISVALVAALKEGKMVQVGGGVSPAKASREFRQQEALFAENWYRSIMMDTLG